MKTKLTNEEKEEELYDLIMEIVDKWYDNFYYKEELPYFSGIYLNKLSDDLSHELNKKYVKKTK